MLSCMENSVDPDQLASSEAISSGSSLFSTKFVSGFIQFLKEIIHGISKERAKLNSLPHYLFFGTSKISLGKYFMAIYLSLGKFKILLFPHPCLSNKCR